MLGGGFLAHLMSNVFLCIKLREPNNAKYILLGVWSINCGFCVYGKWNEEGECGTRIKCIISHKWLIVIS